MLLEKLTIFDDELQQRQRVAKSYSERLKGRLTVPVIPEGYTSAWAQYSVLADSAVEREQIMKSLQAAGIPSVIYYRIPLHLQKAYATIGGKPGDFPVSEALSEMNLLASHAPVSQ